MMNEIATITDSNKDLIRRNYCPSATPDEFEMFRAICNRYGLDPFCREAWFVKYGGSQAQIFVGRDGMLAIANRSGQFDGIETNPNFDEKGNLVSATCTVWRKDMSHPFTKTVYLKEYTTGKSLWVSKPITMLQKVAEAQALRAAFSISGLYCQEEMSIDEPVRIEREPTDIPVEPVKEVTKPVPAMPKTAKPTCNTVTVEEVNLRYLPIYFEQKLDTSVFASADLGDGKYNKDMIDEDYRRQKGLTPQTKPEPEVHTESGLDEFKAEVIKDATENHKRTIDQPFCVDCGNTRVLADEEKASRAKYGVALCPSCLSKRTASALKAKELAKAGEDALQNLVKASASASAPVSTKQTAPSKPSKQTKPTTEDSQTVCSICGKKMTKGELSKWHLFNPGKPIVCSECLSKQSEN